MDLQYPSKTHFVKNLVLSLAILVEPLKDGAHRNVSGRWGHALKGDWGTPFSSCITRVPVVRWMSLLPISAMIAVSKSSRPHQSRTETSKVVNFSSLWVAIYFIIVTENWQIQHLYIINYSCFPNFPTSVDLESKYCPYYHIMVKKTTQNLMMDNLP